MDKNGSCERFLHVCRLNPDFGLAAGKDYGFNMDVNLRIQMEAIQGGLKP